MIKKLFTLVVGILLVLTMFPAISSFEYGEDNEGNPFYKADAEMKVPSINIEDLFILQPSSEPSSPEIGMIYFDSGNKKLKLYDGTGWYSIALEKVSTISKQQVKETIKEKSSVQECSESTECGEWGDCINNYQSMTCITIDEDCNKYQDTETRDCVSDFKLESSAKDSHKITESVDSEETAETENIEADETKETPSETDETSESVEESGIEKESEEDEEVEVEQEEVKEKESKEEKEEPEPAEETPEELFDITFDLEELSLGKSDKLVVWVTLQNFGKRYVPARLVYSVFDKEGKEVYKKFEEIRVYTDESIITKFDDLTLKEGDYKLAMRVEYAGIVEEFSDDFSVETGIISSVKRFFKGLF